MFADEKWQVGLAIFSPSRSYEARAGYGGQGGAFTLSNGEYDSVNLFITSLNCYEERIPHILVRNFGLCDEWSQVEEDKELQKLIKKYRVKIIDFPKLGYKERYLINQKRLKFSEATKDRDFSVLGKQRVVNFLKAAYISFDNAGVWHESA